MTVRDDRFSPAQPRPREPGWTWPLVCGCQAFLYLVQLGVFPFVMWGVYGDGNPTAHENQNAGRRPSPSAWSPPPRPRRPPPHATPPGPGRGPPRAGVTRAGGLGTA